MHPLRITGIAVLVLLNLYLFTALAGMLRQMPQLGSLTWLPLAVHGLCLTSGLVGAFHRRRWTEGVLLLPLLLPLLMLLLSGGFGIFGIID